MAGDPFRERHVPAEEVRCILKRAAELATIEASDGAGRALTEAELVAGLAALGIPADVAKRAMDVPTSAADASADGAVRVVREIEIDGMVGPERHEELADAIGVVMKLPGRVSVVGNKLSWVPGGVLTEPAVTVHAKNGRTRVHYVETLANRGQLTLGFGILSVFGGMIAGGVGTGALAATAKAMGISARQGGTVVLAMGIVVAVAAAIAAMIALRRLFGRRVQRRNAFADEVIAHVATTVREAIASEPRARIAAPLRVDVGPAEAADETDAEPRRAIR